MDYPSLLRELNSEIMPDDASATIIEMLQKRSIMYESFKAASKAPDNPASSPTSGAGTKALSPDNKYAVHRAIA